MVGMLSSRSFLTVSLLLLFLSVFSAVARAAPAVHLTEGGTGTTDQDAAERNLQFDTVGDLLTCFFTGFPIGPASLFVLVIYTFNSSSAHYRCCSELRTPSATETE